MSTPLEVFTAFFQKHMSGKEENHFNALGLRFVFADVGRATLDLPYDPKLVTNPANGAIGVGAIMALVDSTCALAAATATGAIRFSPTLDLRIDHLRPAIAGVTIRAEAEVYRKTRSIIFTRGTVFQSDRDKAVANFLVNFTPIDHAIIDVNKRAGRVSEQ